MSIIDANAEDLMLGATAAPPAAPKRQEPRFSIWATLGAAPKGLAAGASEAIGSAADILGAYGSVAGATDARGGGMFSLPTEKEQDQQNKAQDALSKNGPDYMSGAGRSFRNVAGDYMPDPFTAHSAETIVGEFFRAGGKAITAGATLGPLPGAVVAGLEEGFTASDKLAQQGVDLATRTKVGAVTAGSNALSFALPVAGKTWAQTAALVAVGGPIPYIAQQAATREILRSADYSKLSDQYDPFDPVGLTLSTLLPMGFGAMAMRSARVRAGGKSPGVVVPHETIAPDSVAVDAARVQLLREAVDSTNPLPGDISPAHSEAYAKAINQLADGERVSVADGLPDAAAAKASSDMAARLEPLRKESTMGPGDVAMRNRLEHKIASDFPATVKEYAALPESNGGKILNTDTARELSPDYMADRTKSAPVHEPASQFIKDLYAQKLAEPPKPGELPVVLFTAGGTGAGKSTAVKNIAEISRLSDMAQIVYDTNMNGYASSKLKIEQALNAGKDAAIVMVVRDPHDALINGALPRAENQRAKFGTGRTVPIAEHIKTHAGSLETVKQLAAEYANNPRVTIRIIDNSLGKGKAAQRDLAWLHSQQYNGIEQRLHAALDEQYATGKISAATYEGFAGKPASTDPGGRGPDSRVPAQHRNGHDTSPQQGQHPTQAVAGFDPVALAAEASRLLGDSKSPAEAIGRIQASGGKVSPELQNMLIGVAEFSKRVPELVDQFRALQSANPGASPIDLIADAVERMRAGSPVDTPAAVSALDASIEALKVGKPTALDAQIPVEFDASGKVSKSVKASEFLDMVKQEAAHEVDDARLLQVAANCFISNGGH